MRIMAIDIGTNSTLHLIADVSAGGVKLVERGITGNRLGSDIKSGGIIDDELLEYNASILRELKKKAKAFNCIGIKAVGTHALRNATNANDFIAMSQHAGIPLEIISDHEEAGLTWCGVFGTRGPDRSAAVLDLGGGSTELIAGQGSEIGWSDSIPLGAVIAARCHFHHDPPLDSEIRACTRTVETAFSRWSTFKKEKYELTGVAGTVTSLLAVKYGMTSYSPGAIEGLILDREDVRRFREMLFKMDLTGRKALPGMPTARAGSIHAGALMLEIILEILGLNRISGSEKGVLFGLAQSMIETDTFMDSQS